MKSTKLSALSHRGLFLSKPKRAGITILFMTMLLGGSTLLVFNETKDLPQWIPQKPITGVIRVALPTRRTMTIFLKDSWVTLMPWFNQRKMAMLSMMVYIHSKNSIIYWKSLAISKLKMKGSIQGFSKNPKYSRSSSLPLIFWNQKGECLSKTWGPFCKQCTESML
jgi:hypothetical protein